MTTIYLDNAATTPLGPEVWDAMLPYLTEDWGNASSAHRRGVAAFTGVFLAFTTLLLALVLGRAGRRDAKRSREGQNAEDVRMAFDANHGGGPRHR